MFITKQLQVNTYPPYTIHCNLEYNILQAVAYAKWMVHRKRHSILKKPNHFRV